MFKGVGVAKTRSAACYFGNPYSRFFHTPTQKSKPLKSLIFQAKLQI
nr:MAG TPA: hypothetical protein [Caudoviricetes sp.]